MKRFVRLFANLLLLLLVFTVLPAGATAAGPFDEELVVTATKIPQPITEVPGLVQTIEAETIAADPNQSVTELLLQEGFTVSTHGGDASYANIQLGGAAAEQTLIMVDGIPLYGGNMDQVDLSSFPVAGVEKIEVVHGPLSALYGANALGGVVNIIPNLTGEPAERFSLSGGSFGAGRGSLQIARERWGLAIGGARTDGHRPHSAAERYDLAAQINLVQHESGLIKFYGGYRVKNAELPASAYWPGYGNQEDEYLFLNLVGKREYSNNSWTAKLSYQSWDNYYEGISDYSQEQDRHLSTRWSSDLTFRQDHGTHRFLAGLAFNYDHIDSTKVGNRARRAFGLYLQDLWDLNDALLLHSGLRWDWLEQHRALSPRVGLTWFPGDRLTFGLNYGTAFRVPTMNDLYSEWVEENPELKPEKGSRWELIGHWQEAEWSVTANLFLAQLKDGIVWLDPDGDWIYKPENIKKIRTVGFNLNARRDWGPIKTSLGYAFVNQKGWDDVAQAYTRDLNFFGQHRLYLKGQATVGRVTLNTGCQVVGRRRDERFTYGKEPGKMPDYFLLSAGLRYQLRTNYAISLEVENLTDTQYQIQEGYPMPGRNFKLTFSGSY
ncbi:MAG: TonB-dependent receptor [Firmicutes bacterium]|nr:TonB-dependent receptor [Bacillota bacterium]